MYSTDHTKLLPHEDCEVEGSGNSAERSKFASDCTGEIELCATATNGDGDLDVTSEDEAVEDAEFGLNGCDDIDLAARITIGVALAVEAGSRRKDLECCWIAWIQQRIERLGYIEGLVFERGVEHDVH